MTSTAAFLVLGILAAASAAPWPSNIPQCSTECPIAGSPKLFYASEKTYVYSYSGKSHIQLKDVEGANADMEWSSQVEVTWLTPCDMAISIKNPSIGGGSAPAEAKLLERYPLVVAMIDGRVQQACNHPEDDVWSVNMKKGIASAFQNTLPSNSSINTGLNYTETDIVGNCSTRYEVENQGETVLVKKMKNHRFCQDRYVNQAETPKAWPKTLLPMEESESECKQEIKKGIYTNINCRDKNIIRPAFGSYKFIEALQESTLRFQSETDQPPAAISNLQGHLVRKSLRYDQETQKKDSSLVAKVEESLKQVCDNIKEGVKENAASHVAEALHYLRRIPEEKIPEILQKVRSGQICADQQKLEGLFLDALAFIHEPGAVKVMVQELLSGKATGGRAALYTAALYFTPRPCIHSVKAVQPLFENYQRFPRTAVAAASMVNTYCRQNTRCQDETPVRQLAETLSSKVSQKCSTPGNEEAREEALVLMKALGNMGVINSEIARPIIQCIGKEDADNSIRVAATQAFRNVQCHPEFEQSIKQLVNIAIDPRKGTEARIGAYLAAMKCAKYEDVQRITNRLSTEENTQVRGFIFSHLLNVQESSAPYKQDLRYLLSSIVLPSNFTNDMRKYSRNIDLSYYAPSFDVGAGVESNVIYAPGSFLPRSANLNLTAALGATPLNFGEIGVRLEGLEPVLEELFGPEGYLRKTPTGQIFRDISSSLGDKVEKIKQHLEGTFRQKRSIDFSAISHLFEKLYGDRRSQMPKADFYARINDQEMAFASLAGDLKNINVDELIDRFFDRIDEMINQASTANVDSVRTAQVYLDYHVPTMQGIPIKMKLSATAVAGLKMETRLNGLSGGSNNIAKFIPSLSSQVDGFIGFDNQISQVGIKINNRVSTAAGASINVKVTSGNGFELEVDLPEKMELINVNSETYLLKAIKGQRESKIHPSSVRSTRVQKQSCITALEPVLGLKLCYNLDLPNVFLSEGLPLGPPTVAKIFLKKSDSSMRGYRMKANVENVQGKKAVKIEMEAPGSSTERKAKAMVSYSREGDLTKLASVVESQRAGGIKVEINKKWTESQKQLVVNVYGSRSRQYSPDTKQIEAQFMMADDGQVIKIDVTTRTQATIKEYLDVNFEARGDLRYSESTRIPVPQRLRKFECAIASGRWNFLSFIQEQGGSQYKLALKFGQKGSEIFDIEGIQTIEGRSYRDITLRTDLRGKIGSSQYKSVLAMYWNGEKMGTTFKLLRGDGAKLSELEALINRSGETYKLNFLFDVPAYIRALRFDATAAHQGSSRYQIQVEAKHGDSSILRIDGPITAVLSSKTTNLQTQLTIVCMRSQPYAVSTSVLFTQNKQLLAFELKRNPDRIIAVEWTMATSDEQETKMNFKLLLPSMIEKTVNVIISEKVMHLSVSQLVMPTSSSRRRINGFIDFDFESKKAQAELKWDADRNPNKKFRAEATLTSGSSTLQQSVIQGGWTYLESTYQFKTEFSLADPRAWFNGRNNLKLEFTTAAHRTFNVESVLTIENESSSPKVDASVTFRTPESREYRLNAESSIEWLGGAYNMKLTSRSEFVCPQGRRSQIEVEAQHRRSSSQRDADLKLKITSPSLKQPVQTTIRLNNQESQYSTKWIVERGSAADAASYELRLSPEGGVQSFKTEVNLAEVVNLLKDIDQFVSSRDSSGSGRSPAPRATYLIEYKKHSSASHSLKIKTPSRSMESEVTYSPSEYRVKFVPNKGVSDAKYELYGKRSYSEWEKKSRVQGHLSHPSLERDWQIDAQYSRNGQKVSGSVELDIFPKPEDKITGKLESTIISENTVSVEAQLSGKALKVTPRVVVAAAYGPSTVGFDIQFQKTSSSPISFLMSGKFDREFGQVTASSFTIKTDGRTVMDISGSSHSLQYPSCYGIRIGAKAKSSVVGTYDIYANLCKPLFVDLITSKEGSAKMYMTRIGLLGTRDLEVSVSEMDPETHAREFFGMARAKLTSPSLLKIETKYEGEQLRQIKSTVEENWSRITSSAGSWLDEISREVLKEPTGGPAAQISGLWQEIKDEASRIYEDLEYDSVIPSIDRIRRLARSEIVRGFEDYYRMLWSQYAQIQQRMASSASEAIRNLQTEFDDISGIFVEVVMGTARSLQTGEAPEGLRRLWEQFQETSIYRAVKQEIDFVMNQYPQDYQGLQQIVEKVKSTLGKDFEKQRQNLMQLSRPRAIINWIVNHFNFDRMVFMNMDKVVKDVVQNALFLSVQLDSNHMQLQMPIRRPVYSLPQALSYASMTPVPSIDTPLWTFEDLMPTPVDNMIWAYYSFVPRHASYLLPPYNRTAVVVEGKEILTFDGAVLRTPHSQCMVLLAQYKSNSLVMKNQQPDALPEFIMKTAGVIVEVKSDFTVTFNGQPVSGSEQEQGEVKVFKSSEKIRVRTPFATLRVYQKSRSATVEVSGWTYGHIAGLLGTYDGEMGNDWMTPRGSMASSLQELVRSWQEDQQCQTPNISPESPLKTPVAQMVHCQALLGVRSRCNPVVRQEPFMKMCYASKNACHVARAYSAFCATKGVRDTFPIGC